MWPCPSGGQRRGGAPGGDRQAGLDQAAAGPIRGPGTPVATRNGRGESHYFLGQRYRLRIHDYDGPAWVYLRGSTSIDLSCGRGPQPTQRERVLQRWYRRQLKLLVPRLLEKWQPILGVQAAAWGIRKMKTKWGSCNVQARRLWLNLELAKKPEQCIEYIVVHELMHLLERRHNERFVALMDQHLPNWRSRRDELNQAPLGHDEWRY